MRILISVIACLVVLGGTAGLLYLLDLNQPATAQATAELRLPVVQVQIVTLIDKRIDISSQGTVAPRTEIQLVAQVSGEAIHVAPTLVNGGFFRQDDTLVQLDQRDYQFAIIRAAAQVKQTDLQLSLQLAEADIARREWQQLGKGKASPLTLREPQVAEARAALAAAQASLSQAKLALQRTTIRAPFDGRVRHESVDIGQFVTQGSAMATIYAIDSLEVRLPLHDGMLKYLDLPLALPDSESPASKPLTATLSTRFAQATHTWAAEIVRTEGEIDAKTRMVHAIARVDAPYARQAEAPRPPLTVGMFVTAEIHGRTYRDVVEVPRQILDGDQVIVVDAEDRLHRRTVELLFTSGRDTAVLSGGLRAGERLCLSPIPTMFEGMQVRVATDSREGDK